MQSDKVQDVVQNSTLDATYIKQKQTGKQSWKHIWIPNT